MAKTIDMKARRDEKYTAYADAGMVRRAIEFAATADVRFYLCGVCIKPSKSGGVLVMGTDGHTALVLHDPNGKADAECILPFTKGASGKALAMPGAAYVTVGKDQRVTVTTFDDRTLFIHPEKPIDAKYPDVVGVIGDIKNYEPGLKGTFNPDYLARAINSVGKGRAKYKGVAFYSRKGDATNLASIFTTPDGVGIFMPVHDNRGLGEKLTKDFGGIS
ncbi:MAG TPA: hypothetical protein VIG97_01385 [Luteimonas sp.]